MKKLLVVLTLVGAVSATALAQGNFQFSGASKGVWDNYSTANGHISGQNIDVSFFWGTGTPLIQGIAGSGFGSSGGGIYTPTNGVTTGTTFSVSTAWTDILTDPNFHMATNGVTPVVQLASSSNGGFSYNGGTGFAINAASGQAYNVFVIGWNATYADPFAAQAAGSAVGWSQVFSYTATTGVTQPALMSGSALPFGVISSTPEPGTMALAALGGASLLLFRRRK